MATTLIESHTSEANGQQLHYLTTGEGPPLLLLHGWPQHSHHWRSIMPHLAKRFTIIAPDLRGSGGSTKPRFGYTKRKMAEDVHELIKKLTGNQNVHLCGYDHGAGVAYQYASRWPDEVTKIAFLEFILPGFGYEGVMRPQRGWEHAWQLATFTVPDVCERFFIGRERELLSWYFWRGADNPDAVSEEDFEKYVRTLQLPNALRAGMEYFAAVWDDADDNKITAKTKLTMPVLALGGEKAMGSNVEKSFSNIAKNIQGTVLPGAGHWLTDEQPVRLADILLTFFQTKQPTKA